MNSEVGRPSGRLNAANAMALLRLIGLVCCAISATPSQSAEPKPQSAEAFKLFFHKFNPELSAFAIVDRRRINPGHSLIVVRATSPEHVVNRDIRSALNHEVFGVFVSVGAEPQRLIELDIFPTERFRDFEVHIMEAGLDHAIIAKTTMTYGGDFGRVKYFFDLRNGKRLGRFGYFSAAVSSALEFEGYPYFLASVDRKTTMIARLSQDPVEPLRGHDVIRRIQGREIPLVWRARAEGDMLVLEGGDDRFSLARGVWKVEQNPARQDGAYNTYLPPVPEISHIRLWVPASKVQENLVTAAPVGGSRRRLLIWNGKLSANNFGAASVSGIYDIRDGAYRFHPLPQSEHLVDSTIPARARSSLQ